MKNKINSILIVLLLLTLLASPVSAGPGIGLSSVMFSLGSLKAEGVLSRLGSTDVDVVLDAIGIPVITCTNNGSNDVPGQSAPKVTASGKKSLLGDSTIRKNGKSPFDVETEPVYISWDAAGCPNANWSARVDFVLWTEAIIRVKDAAQGTVLLEQKYNCKTEQFPPSVSCTVP